MYCKNCGSYIEEGLSKCTSCNYDVEQGDKFCSYCGKEVKDYMSVCSNCGNTLKGQTTIKEAKEKSITSEFRANVLNITYLSLFTNIVSVFLLIFLLFLPIYSCESELIDAKSFSLIDEIKLYVDIQKAGIIRIPLSYMLLPFAELLYIIIASVVYAIRSCKDIINLMMLDRHALNVKYRKTKIKKGIARNWRNILSVVPVLVLGDIILTKIIVKFSTKYEENKLLMCTRHMNFFDGVTSYVAIVAILYVGLIILTVKKTKEEIKIY